MFHYYMFNKPFGCVTARRDSLYPTVMDYFSELNNDNLNPVGRLDRETTGLLLITDDGVFNQKLTHPSYHKEKTYHFTVLGDLTEDRCQQLEKGILLCQRHIRMFWFNAYTVQLRNGLHRFYDYAIKRNC